MLSKLLFVFFSLQNPTKWQIFFIKGFGTVLKEAPPAAVRRTLKSQISMAVTLILLIWHRILSPKFIEQNTSTISAISKLVEVFTNWTQV